MTGEQLGPHHGIPHYLYDLNAIHEVVVSSLDYTEMMEFISHCRDIAHRDNTLYVFLDAKQYCEAFLKTKHVWK